jgi:hypothetical protein
MVRVQYLGNTRRMTALKAAWIVHTGAYRGARSSPETATIATPPRKKKMCGFSA